MDSQRSREKTPPKVLREARNRERDSKWLSHASPLTLQKYRGRYVAVKDKRIVASSPTMKGLYARLDKLNPGMVLITRIEKPTLLVYVQLH